MEMSPELKKIDKNIQSLNHALSQTAHDHPNIPLLLACLGTTHTKRFNLLSELDDLEKAIEYKTITLTMTPDNNPGLPELLFGLAAVHGQRFQRLGDPYDIEKAIEYGHISVELTTIDDSALALRLTNLGTYQSIRFENLSEVTDLEAAIQCQSRALALTPNEDPNLPRILANLGVSHSRQFERLGEMSDLENAIEYESRALALTPDGDPGLPSRLANLGVSHSHRFERLGELSDLENAIEYESRALALTPDGHPHLSSILSNLGVSHRSRFECLGELNDLENAMEYQSRALALTPDGHPDLPIILANLGTFHNRQFEHLSELENAIKYQSRALALTPDGHPDLPSRLTNLASSHKNRLEQLNNLSDLEHAMAYESRALALTPDDHPNASRWQFNHARTHLYYYRLTRDDTHLGHSLNFFRSASKSFSGAPRDKFRFAQTWANTASMLHPNNCIEAFQTAIDLLPQFIWLGATTNQRYEDLSMMEALAVDVAHAAIRSSNLLLGLEWLEHARCVVWNQSLMLRSPLDTLQAVYPGLAIQLQAVSDQLHSASSDSRESRALASASMTPEQAAREHRQLAKEYNDLLFQIRKLPGFSDFLQPMKATGLVQAARTGPVVIINCHKDICDALLIFPGDEIVQHVPLPSFSTQKAQEARQNLESSLRCKGIRDRGVKVRQEPGHKDDMSSVLATLWHDVVKPILDYLGCMYNDSSTSMPHITWCPTGTLSFLPLHAAGDYTQPRSRVFDYVVSSYTPTLTALLASSPDSLSASCRVLAVGQANTPGQSALPGTARELAYVQAHMTDSAQYSQLTGGDATVVAVLDAMEQHDWVHFACHAHQNVKDPTKSGFFLHNGTLDLAEINRRSFKGKGMAFLSACQTATGDERLADEAVHLASGMLMAGYASVIATMWSVHDADAPVVADKVYAQLMKDVRIGSGETGSALHNAVATLRERVGEESFERWVPYIHIGS
ncbi:aromatic di-alanine and TPR containing protein [Rhizoctonia solani AG-3 Rhs1AP]|uniref:Aromatic di-alanine and TPR containing protein n=1 Tax=Rhizoctonia solani AG-3 Rhs1AP TaxID=1086054 RepID=X8JFX7_9AGAM|nr:aromatic di-alanine and TPR containing protein [Rhizoctonia solani AG-3 Rhs1AP]